MLDVFTNIYNGFKVDNNIKNYLYDIGPLFAGKNKSFNIIWQNKIWKIWKKNEIKYYLYDIDSRFVGEKFICFNIILNN